MASSIIGQVACFLFSGALVGFAFFRPGVTNAPRLLSIFCSFCLVVVGAVGPQSLLNLTIKAGDSELSFSRHVPTEEEREEALQLLASTPSEKELRESPLVQSALARDRDERSSLDFLLLSRLAQVEKEPAQALELAYLGVAVGKDASVEANLKEVIGESYTDVGAEKVGRLYLKDAARIKPKLQLSGPAVKSLSTSPPKGE